jgi:GntR family transcriptional regulator
VEFRIDRSTGLPAYLQLVRQVREAVRLGWLAPGDRLPPVRQVVVTSGVNVNTVLKAYRELERGGVVEARQGTGTFVKEALVTVTLETLAELREQLADWVGAALSAGLENEDIEALLRSVLQDRATHETREDEVGVE